MDSFSCKSTGHWKELLIQKGERAEVGTFRDTLLTPSPARPHHLLTRSVGAATKQWRVVETAGQLVTNPHYYIITT